MSSGKTVSERPLAALTKNPVMTEEQEEEQRRSWAFGNVSLSNPAVTRRMVDDAADGVPKREEPG